MCTGKGFQWPECHTPAKRHRCLQWQRYLGNTGIPRQHLLWLLTWHAFLSLSMVKEKKKIPFPQKETYSIKETAPGVKEFSFLLVNRLSDEDKTIAETPGQHFTYTEISAPWLSETQAFEKECSCRWRESQLLTHRS